jgi:excisionase family DNA binding protein
MPIAQNNFQGGDEEEMLTISRAASILKVDRGWLSKLINRGVIGSIAVGSHRKVPRWALRKWQEQDIKKVGSPTRATTLQQ